MICNGPSINSKQTEGTNVAKHVVPQSNVSMNQTSMLLQMCRILLKGTRIINANRFDATSDKNGRERRGQYSNKGKQNRHNVSQKSAARREARITIIANTFKTTNHRNLPGEERQGLK